MIQEETHIFQGMRRDNHQIRLDGKFLWDAHNIRLTNRDNSTFLSITNERGTSDPCVELTGLYVGHCVLGQYLIVFTADGDEDYPDNYIYRILKIGNSYESVIIFLESSGAWEESWNPKFPIEALGFYETELVLKVYWVDGKNQPRVINIVADLLQGVDITDEETRDRVFSKDSLNFVRDLALNEDITVTKESGGGTFAPGVIQYAFSYYNKYGQESNIFYTSELMYISHTDRGGSPEDVSGDTFKITIENPDVNFQFLRIYSIHRTSIDATPSVKRVTDIELSDSSKVIYTDTGRTGDTEDPSRLLYIGGEDIIAGTIAQKDNTLFLGNIELNRKPIPQSVIDSLQSEAIRSKVVPAVRQVSLPDRGTSNSLYEYSNQLAVSNVSTFKIGDKYRLGVQFQHKSGKWSEPAWVMDYTIPRDNSKIKPVIDGSTLYLPAIQLKLDSSITSALVELGYKNARAIVVLPSIYERMTLAQGVLCPTVFLVKDRVTNTPFALASWFFRPTFKKDGDYPILNGSVVQYEHLLSLFALGDRRAEIQNMWSYPFEGEDGTNKMAKNDKATSINTFYVDQSIVTMHSPDIEFSSDVREAIDGNELELSIVGLTLFSANAGDISIMTSSTEPAPNDGGFYHKSMLNTSNLTSGVPTGLISGMFYKSHAIDDVKDEDTGKYKLEPLGNTSKNWEFNWLIYPWHRSGSLNNDMTRQEGGGARTSVLERKVISNIRVSKDTYWLNNPWSASAGGVGQYGITPVSIFNSNEMSLIQIPIPKSSNIDAINYYGNVDTLITAEREYTFYVALNEGVMESPNPFTRDPLQNLAEDYGKPELDGSTFPSAIKPFMSDLSYLLKWAKEPVRMKYKSTPHAVFAFNYQDNNSPVILPTINGKINKVSADVSKEVPFWSKSEVTISSSVTEVLIYVTRRFKGTSLEIENQIIEFLSTYLPVNGSAVGDLAAAQCSNKPFDRTWSDLYQYNGSTWVKATIFEDAAYRYEDSKDSIYWKVYNNGVGLSLHQESWSESSTYSVKQGNLGESTDFPMYATLFLAELRRPSEPENMFGGQTLEALRSNMWIPAGKPTPLTTDTTVLWTWGDTYYQRYDCLKTYPFTQSDENSIVEIASFMCETRVNIDGRYDRNRGQSSNLYMTPLNFNLLNDVYSLRDNLFNYRILDKDYYKQHAFGNLITWSKLKYAGEEIDTWTNTTLANTLDMNGEKGKVTSLKTWNENLLCFQEKALSQILFNSRVQIPTTDGVPIEISNGYKVDGSRLLSGNIGCSNLWTITTTPIGVYFLDSNTDSMYIFNGLLTNLSEDRGMDWWIRENHTDKVWNPVPYGTGILNGIRTFYDNKYGDVYFTPGPVSNIEQPDALCYSEQLGLFTSFMSYGGTQAMFNFADGFYSLRETDGNIILYENNTGNYNDFYGTPKEWSFSFISNQDPTITKIFDTIDLRTDHYWTYGTTGLLNTCPMNYIKVENEYQKAEATIDSRNMRKKFRVWRGNIPRSSDTSHGPRGRFAKSRIRNPWAMITLGWKPEGIQPGDKTKKMVLHDVSVHYTV